MLPRTVTLVVALLVCVTLSLLQAQDAPGRPMAPTLPPPPAPLPVPPSIPPAPPGSYQPPQPLPQPQPTITPVPMPPVSLPRESPVKPAGTPIGKTPLSAKKTSESPRTILEGRRLTPMQKQMLRATLRGTDWLARMNGTTGQFVNGLVPSLRVELDDDNPMHQAGAAFGLARAARFHGDEIYLATAFHCLLPLLEETKKDKDAPVRYTTLPSVVHNRLGAAALLVLAIHELPEPGKDLLDPADELCEFIHRQARPDGSLSCGDLQPDGTFGPEEASAQQIYPGQALYALMHSYKLRPAPWKLELVRKAASHYHKAWRENQSLVSVPAFTAAYAEAYLITHEQVFLDAVNEMNDWLCSLQYGDQESGHATLWRGGFMGWLNGKPARTAPTISSAEYAESLAQACRVAREAVDVKRHERYTTALEHCLQFLTTLQYSEASTQHFKETYRERLLGGFHASLQDGNLRIDYSQHALSALVLYLEQIH